MLASGDWVTVGIDNGGTANNGTVLDSDGRFLVDDDGRAAQPGARGAGQGHHRARRLLRQGARDDRGAEGEGPGGRP